MELTTTHTQTKGHFFNVRQYHRVTVTLRLTEVEKTIIAKRDLDLFVVYTIPADKGRLFSWPPNVPRTFAQHRSDYVVFLIHLMKGPRTYDWEIARDARDFETGLTENLRAVSAYIQRDAQPPPSGSTTTEL